MGLSPARHGEIRFNQTFVQH
ncbi:hypothetical protein [Bacillus atrophaeus]|nr:hypothetical protein [Bacillus atrophaeus]MDS9995819.1 hypothetical protein [Bacillus atrophaeus]